MPSPAEIPRVSPAGDPAPTTTYDEEKEEETGSVDDVGGADSSSSGSIEGKEDLRRCGVDFVVR